MNEDNSGKKIIIIGAGTAGISCAMSLLNSGYKIILIEEKDYIGGRAHSFIDKTTGEEIDNGQHLIVGAYENYLNLLKQLGTDDYFHSQKSLKVDFINNDGHISELNSSFLPGKLSLAIGLLNFDLISSRSKLNILKFYYDINSKKINFNYKTALDLLKFYKQDSKTIRNFWEPLIKATMNTPLEKASAFIFSEILKKAIFSGKYNSRLLLPNKPLSFYFEPFKNLFKKSGGELLLKTKVEKLIIENDKISGVKLQNGEFIESDFVISAIPYFSINKILPDELLSNKYLNFLNKIESSPIISAYIWFDKEITDKQFAALLETNIQWIFNRRKIMKYIEFNKDYPYCYELTISAANDLISIDKSDLIEIFIKELRNLFNKLNEVNILNIKIIKEKRATLLCSNEINSIRPDFRTPIKNFFICGDWTNTNLPATLESAAKSGFEVGKIISSFKNES